MVLEVVRAVVESLEAAESFWSWDHWRKDGLGGFSELGLLVTGLQGLSAWRCGKSHMGEVSRSRHVGGVARHISPLLVCALGHLLKTVPLHSLGKCI